jgi:hypothetical protein
MQFIIMRLSTEHVQYVLKNAHKLALHALLVLRGATAGCASADQTVHHEQRESEGLLAATKSDFYKPKKTLHKRPKKKGVWGLFSCEAFFVFEK